MVLHYCEIHETDVFMTKLHPVEVQLVISIISNLGGPDPACKLYFRDL